MRTAGMIAALLLIGSVLTSPDRSGNTGLPLLSGAQVEPPILALFEKACQDCHSEKTRYPWYSYVAPVSWLIERDVARGRTRLNLSRWNELSLIRRERSLSEIANQVQDGDMPLWQYTIIHRGARLSPNEANAIFQWTQRERARLIEQSFH